MKCVENNTESIKEAISALKAGKVIAHPADTCYGLAADLFNSKSLEKLQVIKGREAKKPMSIMLPAYMKADLHQYAQLSELASFVCNKLLPGPVTIVLPKGDKLPDYYFPEISTVGIRIPYDMLTETLLTKFKGPLITTSANLSTEPICCTCKEVETVFKGKKNKPDLLIRGAIRNYCQASTVIQVDKDKVKILREGPIDKKQLEALLGVKVMF